MITIKTVCQISNINKEMSAAAIPSKKPMEMYIHRTYKIIIVLLRVAR